MALLLIEGFDHLTAGQIPLKGWVVPGRAPVAVAGRFGGQAMQQVAGGAGSNGSLYKLLPSTVTTAILGIAVNVDSQHQTGLITAGVAFIAYITKNGVTGFAEIHNSAGTLMATGSVALNGWHYLELKVVVNGASGSCELHVDGVVDIPATTGNFGSTAIGGVYLNMASSPASESWDDIYVLDTTGSAPLNTFLGDSRVTTVFPTGAGALSQWTPTGGSTHYTEVDDATPDGDTTYVGDGTVGDIDTYTMGDVDVAAAVYGVQTNLYARKDDVGTRQIAPVIRQAGTNYVGTTVTLASGYSFYTQIYNQDPTAAAWTAANVNADEFGVKEIA